MKKNQIRQAGKKIVGALAGLLLSSSAMSADIVNGWSELTTITQIRSYYSETHFRLDSASVWRLPMDASDAGKYKRAALLAAYMN